MMVLAPRRHLQREVERRPARIDAHHEPAQVVVGRVGLVELAGGDRSTPGALPGRQQLVKAADDEGLHVDHQILADQPAGVG
jgi:hypothetical protein